ncbi:MAG: EAL domain-containing protein [Coriobacteriales bacterium]|nr:EAL domain-containing protein [Coriobacteriales bacterium]
MDEQAIRQALEEDRVIPYFQPQFDAITGKLRAAEALCRILDTDGGIIPPRDFIPVAEQTHLVCEIDRRVLIKVCEFLGARIKQGKLVVPISVNASRQHFSADDSLENLVQRIEGMGVPCSLLTLEITESATLHCGSEIVQIVQDIRDAGLGVAIDDFGSGVSSLSLVKDINAGELKLDRSLLSANCESEKERIVLESIFQFAQRLGMRTVAEGVETVQQLEFLRTCGCDIIQGYLYSKPLPPQDFADLLDAQDESVESDDVLTKQSTASAVQMLLQAIFARYPLVIFGNLTRNSYYMMAYDCFTSTGCPSAGVFSELIASGASTMAPEDQERFMHTFSREELLAAHAAGKQSVRLVTHQMGDDGAMRPVEVVDYFVQSPSSSDVLVVSLSQNLEE